MLAVVCVQADVWVDELPAYSTITQPGETIRVMQGQYFDVLNFEGNMIEVSPGVFEDKWVNIIADAGVPAVTTITGNFTDHAVRFGGSGGTLSGFTIEARFAKALSPMSQV